jgi:septation ring formation regulator EzrA
MRRNEKLYQRLDRLEIEYLQLLKGEFEKVLEDAESWYLMAGRGYRRTKTYRTADDQRIESLDSELGRLRDKLGEPIPNLYKEIAEFVEAMATFSVRRNERKSIAHKILKSLEKHLQAIHQPPKAV